MKNKKAILILMVLIITSLVISGVSASDVNTTDSEVISASSQNIDSIDESADLHEDNELLSVSDDDSSTVQYNSNTFTKL